MHSTKLCCAGAAASRAGSPVRTASLTFALFVVGAVGACSSNGSTREEQSNDDGGGVSSGGGGDGSSGSNSVPAPNDASGGGNQPCPTGAIGKSGTFDESVTIDKVSRTYVLDVSDAAVAAMSKGCGAPLVIGLHGAGDTASNFLAYSQLPDSGSKHGFVVAGPDAYAHLWMVSTSDGWPSTDGHPTSAQNDIALVQQIISDTGKAYRIDPKRIYVCGWSRGAGFTGFLAAGSDNPTAISGLGITFTSPFAAFGMTAGFDAMAGTGVDYSKSSPKRPGWLIHGTADQAVPFSDGQTFASTLTKAGWTIKFTPVQGAPHDWLWQSKYGYSDDDLWAFFAANPLP